MALSVARWLRLKYLGRVLWRFDAAADLPLSQFQAGRVSALNGGVKGWPDLFIAEPRGTFNGLYVELKKSRDEVYRRDGAMRKSAHLERQVEIHEKLRDRGYAVVWGFGVIDACKKIEAYLDQPLR